MPTDRELLEAILQRLTRVETLISDGIVNDIRYLKKSHSWLKRQFYLLIGFLVGSGILGVSIFKLFG